MPIVLCRIDNRLLHGQVATQWMSSVDADLIVVVNDRVAQDEFAQGLMDLVTPSFCTTRYFSVAEAIEEIPKAELEERIAIICESPQEALELVEAGLAITKINIGNMHMAAGKRQVTKIVCVDDADVAVFNAFLKRDIELEIRRVPSEKTENIKKLFK